MQKGFAFCTVIVWSILLISVFISKEYLLCGSLPINRFYLTDVGKINCMDIINGNKHKIDNKQHSYTKFAYFYLTPINDDNAKDSLEKDREVKLKKREEMEKTFMSYEKRKVKKEVDMMASWQRTEGPFRETKMDMKKFEIPLDTDRISVFCSPDEEAVGKWVYLLNYIQHKGMK